MKRQYYLTYVKLPPEDEFDEWTQIAKTKTLSQASQAAVDAGAEAVIYFVTDTLAGRHWYRNSVCINDLVHYNKIVFAA